MLYSIVRFPEFYVMFTFATKDALFMATLDFLMVSNYNDEWRDFHDHREQHVHYFTSFSECV